jgi:hypothetical protein
MARRRLLRQLLDRWRGASASFVSAPSAQAWITSGLTAARILDQLREQSPQANSMRGLVGANLVEPDLDQVDDAALDSLRNWRPFCLGSAGRGFTDRRYGV